MKKANKNTPNSKKDKKGAKIENELSELAKSLGIRVSSPYGYYPDDVDPIIKNLQKSVSDLTKENKKLADDLYISQDECSKVKNELTRLKMEISLMEYPDISQEEGFAMLSRMDSITGNYNSESLVDLKQKQLINTDNDNNTKPKSVKINLKPKN